MYFYMQLTTTQKSELFKGSLFKI